MENRPLKIKNKIISNQNFNCSRFEFDSCRSEVSSLLCNFIPLHGGDVVNFVCTADGWKIESNNNNMNGEGKSTPVSNGVEKYAAVSNGEGKYVGNGNANGSVYGNSVGSVKGVGKVNGVGSVNGNSVGNGVGINSGKKITF